ncbi:hypothetical protein IC619_012865 [Hazenella sp. IB182353]|uniref:hypothetical protein n=1 Tax=Polycladospora coralii TaxID=2771432 RepID=UPI0017470BF0|nr:hypothetical protein [Polycladospora coralii]MBS7531385.1 hypothetical protein [Polycladospora coralii]
MHKKMIIILVCLFLLCSLFTGCHSKNPSNQNQIYQTLLEKGYFEEKSGAFFYDNFGNKLTNTIDPYQVYWNIKLSQIIGIDLHSDSMNMIKDELQNQANLSQTAHLYDIYIRASLDKLVLKEPSHKRMNAYKQILFENHYNKEDGLFFWESRKESMEDKITATTLAISIMKQIDTSDIALDKTRTALEQLFLEDDYFTSQPHDMQKNLLNEGGAILKSLQDLDVSLDRFPRSKVEQRKKWVTHWLQEINQSKEFPDIFAKNEMMIHLYHASTYMGIDSKFSKDLYHDSIISIISTHQDPQLLYKMIYTNALIERKELSDTELRSIQKWRENWIYQGDIKFNLKDNYYGLLAAQSINMPFNKRKLINTLDTYTKNRSLSIRDLFFWVRTLDQLNELENNKSKLVYFYKEALSKSKGSLEDHYYLTYINHILTKKLENIDIEKVENNKQNIQDRIRNSKNSKELFYAFMINHYHDPSEKITNIENQVHSYRAEQTGGYFFDQENRMINIISIYDMIRLKQHAGLPINQTELKHLERVLKRHQEKHGATFMTIPSDDPQNVRSNYQSQLTLETIYYGIFVNQYILENRS